MCTTTIEPPIEKMHVSDYMQSQGGIDAILRREKTNLACIIAGTGSGKSYWIRNVLADGYRVLYVTSRSAKVLQDKGLSENGIVFSTTFEDKVSSICNIWQLGELIKNACRDCSKEEGEVVIHSFLHGYDYIVFDEFHSLVCDSLFNDNLFNVAMLFYYSLFVIKKPTIVLTATIQPVTMFLDAIKRTYLKQDESSTGPAILDLTHICDYVLPKRIRIIHENKMKNEMIQYLLVSGKRIVYFMNLVGEKKAKKENHGYTITQEYDFLMECGLKPDEVAVIVSKSSQAAWDKKHNCSEDYTSRIRRVEGGAFAKITYNEWVREEIALNNEIPDKVRVLLCSATLNEGVNIENLSDTPFRFVISDAHYISTLIQQMGRLRRGTEEFWIINDAKQHSNNNDEIEHALLTATLPSSKSILALLTEYAESITDFSERYKFIHWITKRKDFSLLTYSDITHRFEFNHIRYNMREEVTRVETTYLDPDNNELSLWENALEHFTKKYGVTLINSHTSRDMANYVTFIKVLKHIEAIVNIRLCKDDWSKEVEFFQSLGLGARQNTINKNLEKLCVPYRLHKQKKGKNGFTIFWFAPLREQSASVELN